MSSQDTNDVNSEKTSTNDGTKEIPQDVLNFQDFTKSGYKTLLESVRNSNALPSNRDWNFYSTHDSFKKIMDKESNRLLSLINGILRHYNVDGNIRNRILDEKTELLIEANDVILERAANNIDEMNGISKTQIEPVEIQTVSAQIPVNASWNRISNATFSVNSSITRNESTQIKSISLLTAKNIVRPQKFFKDKINNNSDYPWEPRITDKPNSLKPLAIFLEETENGEEYSHPYEFELDRFEPNSEQLLVEEPVQPKLLENTPLIEINTPEQLDELVESLRNYKEFAVDLEHHSYRTFMGITCLMQISTKDTDYLIDTLALRDKLFILNEVFTKPSIVKIFHGADSDIKWLQRDLSVYVVNMFDTHQAAKQLGYSSLSLANLLERFCNFLPNKQFQLADWRIRPLPDELKLYAREDTHYLIYIYQRLKKELLEKSNGQDNLLRSTIQRSTEICKKRYFKPVFTPDSYMDFYRKCKRMFDNRQLYALKELYKWRDRIAREEDESIGYVLPNHMLLQISETLPREVQGILACCSPIPPLIRANLLDLHQIILKARDQSLSKPIFSEDTRARGTTKKMSKINVDSPLYCPHDLTKITEFRDDLPTVVNKQVGNVTALLETDLEIERTNPINSVFATLEGSEDETESVNKAAKLTAIQFLGPFERYQLVKRFTQAEEERLDAEAKKINEERTDEERIESVKKHFLNLSSQISPEKKPKQSLVEMGGSKKRKRKNSDSIEELVEENEQLEIKFHTTVPNVIPGQRKRRSSGDICDTPAKIDKPEENSSQKEKRTKKKIFKNQRRMARKKAQKLKQESQINQNQEHQKVKQEIEVNQQPQRKANQNQQQQGNSSKQQQSRKNNKKKFPPRNRQNTEQRSQQQQYHTATFDSGPNNFYGNDYQFVPYDYSSVDFRQFGGGAGSAQQPQEFRSNFRGKNRQKRNTGRNKSHTFGQSNRGGRGRGR